MQISNLIKLSFRLSLYCFFALDISLAHAELYESSSALESFFSIEVTDKGARVSAKKKMPSNMWHRACRYGLSQLIRDAVRADLAKKSTVSLPEAYSFAEVKMNGYTSWNDGEWVQCKADVTEIDRDTNLAGLAIRIAWDPQVLKDEERLRAMLKIALTHDFTRDDAIVLLAVNVQKDIGIDYLDTRVNREGIRLLSARLAAAQLYLEHQRYNEALYLVQNCQDAKCDAVYNKAHNAKLEMERSKITDLNSFFKE